MIRVLVHDRRDRRVFSFAQESVRIGRGKDNDLVLELEGVSREHARLFIEDGELVIEDLSSASGVFVRRRKVTRQVLEGDEVIGIGGSILGARLDRFEPEDVVEAEEATFLQTLRRQPRDDEARSVYADWLEEHGKSARAEFLRAQMTLRTSSPKALAFRDASKRLRKLASKVGIGWRARVAMTFIEGSTCGLPRRKLELAFEVECPKRWDEMLPTNDDGIRHCPACDEDVVYCSTIEQARTQAELGGCVALDIAVERSEWDMKHVELRGRPVPNFASLGSKK